MKHTLFFLLLLAWPASATLTVIPQTEQLYCKDVLLSRAFFQSHAAYSRLAIVMHVAREQRTDDTTEELPPELQRHSFAIATLCEDGFSPEEAEALFDGTNQKLAWRAYRHYMERAAPDRALFCLCTPIFSPFNETKTNGETIKPEPPDNKLYLTTAKALYSGKLENGFPCLNLPPLAIDIAHDCAKRGDQEAILWLQKIASVGNTHAREVLTSLTPSRNSSFQRESSEKAPNPNETSTPVPPL